MGAGEGFSKSARVMGAASELGGTLLRSVIKNWRYPAAGLAAAVGIGMLAGSDISINGTDHTQSTTALAQGPESPANIPIPQSMNNGIVTPGPSGGHAGYMMNSSIDVDGRGLSALTYLGQSLNSRVSLRDNRGSITPEYIRKAQNERYV